MTKRQNQIVLAVASVSIIAALMLLLYYYFVTNVNRKELDMYKPKYFSIDELTFSKTAERLGYDLILQMGDFDQLIDESDFSWVHVSYKRVGYNRKQTLKLWLYDI